MSEFDRIVAGVKAEQDQRGAWWRETLGGGRDLSDAVERRGEVYRRAAWLVAEAMLRRSRD